MKDSRQALPRGTKIVFESGSIYEISGEPIGFGGGSIIYPAVRYTSANGAEIPDGFDYVLKECFPVCAAHGFIRRSDGEVVPEKDGVESEEYLRRCRSMQLREEAISKSLYKTAIHTLPIKESAQQEECILPEQPPRHICGVFTAMDSLSLKGTALSSYVKNRRMLPLRQCFSVTRQLLHALKEIHAAGFLHLDIQTGNIFIQGSLAEGESILTLIDFGSARPLTDGHTEVIADRLVFTTQGFAAPEILLHNDGTLVLTPAADIYSAGCVLLNLLTGKRYTSSELISNRSGKYIDAMKLYRIACPRHLSDRLQRIIAKALENEPSARYQTAEEMLDDVESFLAALPLTVTPLANTAFNAFISYRHGDIDSAAALELQKRLERFRAPRGVSDTRKPFKRCYVDEGELSSGYDYAKQLREVLKNSEWLIVVCSGGTRDSRWVNEEIDIFLEYHDRSHVLALLTGGEPEQAFPPRLLEETPRGDLLIAADARGETRGEVLKKIKGDALLKLAAPMLSTTFDSLKQREKVYRLRRISAAAAVCAVLSGAFGVYAADKAATISRQARRIEEEYRTALLNESMFLTEQAEKRLEKDDTAGAAALALRALPSQTQERPVLAAAKDVLTKVLGAYVMPGKEALFDATKFFSSEKVYKIFSDANGRYVFTLEDGGKRVCARALDFTPVNSAYFDDEISKSDFAPEHLVPNGSALIIRAGLGLYRWDYESGALKKLLGNNVYDLLLSPDGKCAAVVLSEYDEARREIYRIALVDAETGEITEEYELAEYNGGSRLLAFAPDENALLFSEEGSFSVSEAHDSVVSRLDFTTGGISALCAVPDDIYAVSVIDNFLVVCSSFDLTVYGGEDMAADSRPANLLIFDLEKGESVCRIEETKFAVIDSEYRIEAADYDDGEVRTKAAVFTFANYCEVVALDSGKVLRKYEFPSPVVFSRYIDNGLYIVLRSGYAATLPFESESVDALIKCFRQELEEVCVPHLSGCFFMRTDDGVLKYEIGKPDENLRRVDTFPENIPAEKFLYEAAGGLSRFALLDDGRLYIADTRENACVSAALPFGADGGGYASPSTSLLGSSADGEYFYIRETSGYDGAAQSGFYAISLSDASAVSLKEPIRADTALTVQDAFFFGGSMYYAALSADGTLRLCSWTPDCEDVTELAAYNCPDGFSFAASSLRVTDEYISFALKSDAADEYVFAAFDRENSRFASVSDTPAAGGESPITVLWDTYCWDLGRGEIVYMFTSADESGQSALSLRISAADSGALTVHSAAYNAFEPCALVPSPAGRLFVVDGSGITEYARSGERLNRWAYDFSYAYSLYGLFNCQFLDDDTMFVSLYPAAAILDLSSGGLDEEALPEYCVGWDAHTDELVMFSGCSYPDKPSLLGCFPRYSTQALVRMGMDFVK